MYPISQNVSQKCIVKGMKNNKNILAKEQCNGISKAIRFIKLNMYNLFFGQIPYPEFIMKYTRGKYVSIYLNLLLWSFLQKDFV